MAIPDSSGQLHAVYQHNPPAHGAPLNTLGTVFDYGSIITPDIASYWQWSGVPADGSQNPSLLVLGSVDDIAWYFLQQGPFVFTAAGAAITPGGTSALPARYFRAAANAAGSTAIVVSAQLAVRQAE